MINRLLLICIFSLSISQAWCQKEGGTMEGVQFVEGGWFEAANKAKEEGKPIFAFIWSESCLESIKMLEDEFVKQNIGSFFNENFVSYKIDGNDLKNNARVSAWGVTGLPTLIFLTPKRKVILLKKGFYKDEELVKIARIALKKM